MRFNCLALMASFAIGMLFMMLSVPKPKVVLKFPTPERAGLDTYHTPAGSCYKVNAEVVTCPTQADKIRPQPVVEDDEANDSEWFPVPK